MFYLPTSVVRSNQEQVEAGCIICKQQDELKGEEAFAGVWKLMTPLNVFLKAHLEYITFQSPSFVFFFASVLKSCACNFIEV
jgi:hypothetical protein